MDHFGIGAAMKAMVRVYGQSARQTGRTQSLVESVKEGDRICFSDQMEAQRVQRLCKERGITVDCIVIPPNDPGQVFRRGTSTGRTIFDHSWVEQYYRLAIEQCEKNIDELERETSGLGAAHRETQRRAQEAYRWESW